MEVVADSVQFLDTKGSNQNQNNQAKPQNNNIESDISFEIDDDDLPF